jgi:hypothetical protein
VAAWHLVDPELPLVTEDGVPYLGTMCGRTVPSSQCMPPDGWDDPLVEIPKIPSEDVCPACRAAEVDDLLTPHKT